MLEKNKIETVPWYIASWFREITLDRWEKMDDEARTFYSEFIPVYREYVGTKGLRSRLISYINTHEIKRKDDFRFQLIGMWVNHIQYYRELHNIPFKAEDIFKIKIPKEILNIQ